GRSSNSISPAGIDLGISDLPVKARQFYVVGCHDPPLRRTHAVDNYPRLIVLSYKKADLNVEIVDHDGLLVLRHEGCSLGEAGCLESLSRAGIPACPWHAGAREDARTCLAHHRSLLRAIEHQLARRKERHHRIAPAINSRHEAACSELRYLPAKPGRVL